MTRTIYVNGAAREHGDGSKEHPFSRIQNAANVAMPGEEILVLPGVYRENVNPVNAGRPDARIEYRASEQGKAIITGAEQVRDWVNVKGDVWQARIPNGVFGSYNPYTTLVRGDWFIATFIAHTGEVYLNDKAMYEVTDLEKVLNPVEDKLTWDPAFSLYTWMTDQDEAANETVLTANFHGADPNRENVEINVRENCFYPVKEGTGYITLSGFKVDKAATQWAPPTAYQEGMIGPHWSKGWIIEDCEVSNSKCSGISLGKYRQPNNDNKWLSWKFKDGTQTERDNICQAQVEGWTKENIGSHIVRRCNIHDCGQTGIVGHLGGVFSLIEENEIHHINNRHNLAGAEIGGIKMHAAIDVVIRKNHIHHCTRGLWLDWQAQGTRVTQNLFHDNTLPDDVAVTEDHLSSCGEDIFVEVSHGPTLIDNNVLLSQMSLKYASQGLAFVHNLVAGSFTAIGMGVNNGTKSLVSPRYTPYHMIHRTEVAGFMTILHGDVRFYNNIFVQRKHREGFDNICAKIAPNAGGWTDMNLRVGTVPYEGYPTEDEWKSEFDGYCGMGSEPSDRYYNPLPVWTDGNVYFAGAKHISKEKNYQEDTEHQVSLKLIEEDGKYYLDTDLFKYLEGSRRSIISTPMMGMAFEPEERFENPDGSEIVMDRDYNDDIRMTSPEAGPFEKTDSRIRVW